MSHVAPRVRVVVLNFDGGQLTLDCLDSLLATDYPKDRLEIVLVDNGSIDDVVERVARDYLSVRVLEPLANLGFAGGCNLGITADGPYDYVALINNDATVTPGWLSPLVETLEARPEIAAVSPKLLFADRYAGVDLIVPDAGAIGALDTRVLGMRLSGVRVDGLRRDGDVILAEGFHGHEPADTGRGEEMASWSGKHGTIRVRIRDKTPAVVSVRLSRNDPRVVVCRSGGAEQRLEVGPRPQWVDVPVDDEFDVINNAGSNLYPHAFGGDRGFLERDRGQFDTVTETFGWCGGAVLLRRSYLDTVGTFDERLFLYYEDFDLSWRGRLRGMRYLYQPASVVRHRHAATSGEWSPVFRFHTERNRVLVAVKNAPANVAARAVAGETRRLQRAVMDHMVRRLARLRFPRYDEPQLRWKVWTSLMFHLPHALAHRWREPISVPRESIRQWESAK
ncbi:MAG: glycosyltransferase family 2 protein [Acidobacteriota bacterium]